MLKSKAVTGLHKQHRDHECVPKENILVTLVLKVFAITVVQKQTVRIVLANPLNLLHIKRALSLHPLALPATRDRDGQTYSTGESPHECFIKACFA